ncbi:MAG: FISUMP domain-containing protein [Bacteroidales bacterium]|jgi:uncharacterized protein (TIGR02145 family)
MKSILITLVCIFMVKFSYSQSLVVTKTDGSKTTIALSDIENITFEDSGFTDFTDSRDGHVYKVVTIGTQTWMAENLAYLPAVSTSQEGSFTTPYYYVYGYEGSTVSAAKATANYGTYGVLYNWPAALTACPSGWHSPTDAEWKILEKNQGMSNSDADGIGWRNTGIVGGKLKETGTSHWLSPNTGATNNSGFTALPGGGRDDNGGFYTLGTYASIWSASEVDASISWYRDLHYFADGVQRFTYEKSGGLSVRCLQD